MGITLQKIESPTDTRLDSIKKIYMEAFPPEERRPWERMFDNAGAPEIYAIHNDEIPSEPIGLITLWELEGFRYVEHFAVAPEKRSGGIGGKVLDAIGYPLILEVEPPESSEEACRRLNFYKRHGFEELPIAYVQPPYEPGLPELPLLLLARGEVKNPAHMAELLHQRIYGVK